MLVHTEKGMSFIEAIKNLIKLTEVDVTKAVDLNKSAVCSSKKPLNYKNFWHEVDYMTVDKLAQKYDPFSRKKKVKLQIKKTKLYKILKRIKGGNIDMESGLLFEVNYKQNGKK